MTAAPAVSVIMAAYKGAALVGETIGSVLAQTLSDFELIIVDDCSPDDTLAVLRRYTDPRITIIAAEENQGPVRTRNRAFALARGRYIAGLDQDDLCRPDRFTRQVAYLDAHPDAVLVAGVADFLEDGRIRPARMPGPTTPTMIRWLMQLRNPLAWSSVMIRGDAARRLDPFTRPEILFAEDFDLYHRLAPMGAIARIDEPLLLYRCHPGGASVMFTERMTASAATVLAAAYAPVLGVEAEDSAMLMARHVGGIPVPDRATLARLAEIFNRLFAAFAAAQPIDDETARLIAHETSRLWWHMVRSSVRSGSMSLREAMAVRPSPRLVQPPAQRADLLLSGVVGAGRALRQSRPIASSRA